MQLNEGDFWIFVEGYSPSFDGVIFECIDDREWGPKAGTKVISPPNHHYFGHKFSDSWQIKDNKEKI